MLRTGLIKKASMPYNASIVRVKHVDRRQDTKITFDADYHVLHLLHLSTRKAGTQLTSVVLSRCRKANAENAISSSTQLSLSAV